MEINQENIKYYKIFNIETKYNEITNQIYNLSDHIKYLDSIYYIDEEQKNNILIKLYNLNKNINNSYNNIIITELENIDHNNKFNSLINSITIFEDKSNLKLLSPLNNFFFKSELFKTEQTSILEIINLIGYSNLLEALYINNINLSPLLLNLINEINDIFIPTKISIFNLLNFDEKDYYWRTPNNYHSNDILQLTRELWIKKTNGDKSYYKIEGIFKSDILCVKIKTCYKKASYLFEKKKNIMKELENHDINKIFIIKFIKYDYI